MSLVTLTAKQIAAYSPQYWGGSHAVTVSPAVANDQTVTEFDRLGNKTQYNISGMNFDQQYVGINFVDTIKKVIFSQVGYNALQANYYPNDIRSFFFVNDLTTLWASGPGNDYALANWANNTSLKLSPISIPAFEFDPAGPGQPINSLNAPLAATNMVNNTCYAYGHSAGYPLVKVSNGVFSVVSDSVPFYYRQPVLFNNGLIVDVRNFQIINPENQEIINFIPPVQDDMGYLGDPVGISIFFILTGNYYGTYAYLYSFSGEVLANIIIPDGSTILGVNSQNELITTTGTWQIQIPIVSVPLILGTRNYCHNYSRGVPTNYGGNLILPSTYNARLKS